MRSAGQVEPVDWTVLIRPSLELNPRMLRSYLKQITNERKTCMGSVGGRTLIMEHSTPTWGTRQFSDTFRCCRLASDREAEEKEEGQGYGREGSGVCEHDAKGLGTPVQQCCDLLLYAFVGEHDQSTSCSEKKLPLADSVDWSL